MHVGPLLGGRAKRSYGDHTAATLVLGAQSTGFLTRTDIIMFVLPADPSGMLGPFLVGALKHSRGNYTAAVLVLAGVMAVGAAFACAVLPAISPDSTLRPRRAAGDLDAGDSPGGVKPAAAPATAGNGDSGDGALSSSNHVGVGSGGGGGPQATTAEARVDDGVQLVPLRSPC